jgi:hypothetical protein
VNGEGRPLDKGDPRGDIDHDVPATVTPTADSSPLRRALAAAQAEHGLSMKDLTVLAPQNDPFRVDTPAGHRDGAWLADMIARLNLGGRQIHLRGVHYKVTMLPEPPVKPDGTPYVNDDPHWEWISAKVAKAARWLGYVPFDAIFDKKNARPIIRPYLPEPPQPYISVGVRVDIPDVDNIEPYVGAYYKRGTEIEGGFGAVQPYKLVLFGEKSDLEVSLAPLAREYEADLYLVS